MESNVHVSFCAIVLILTQNGETTFEYFWVLKPPWDSGTLSPLLLLGNLRWLLASATAGVRGGSWTTFWELPARHVNRPRAAAGHPGRSGIHGLDLSLSCHTARCCHGLGPQDSALTSILCDSWVSKFVAQIHCCGLCSLPKHLLFKVSIHMSHDPQVDWGSTKADTSQKGWGEGNSLAARGTPCPPSHTRSESWHCWGGRRIWIGDQKSSVWGLATYGLVYQLSEHLIVFLEYFCLLYL